MRIPIVARGGFADGRGLVAALALGATGITMGTRFCATKEAPIHRAIKDFLVSNDERATNLIFRKLRNTARVARNAVSKEVVDILSQPGSRFEDVTELVRGHRGREALERGDVDGGILWAGLSQSLIHDIPSVSELLDRIIADAERIITAQQKMLQ